MKRTMTIVAAATLMCLTASSVTLVFAQLSNTGSVIPPAPPGNPPQYGQVVPPMPPPPGPALPPVLPQSQFLPPATQPTPLPQPLIPAQTTQPAPLPQYNNPLPPMPPTQQQVPLPQPRPLPPILSPSPVSSPSPIPSPAPSPIPSPSPRQGLESKGPLGNAIPPALPPGPAEGVVEIVGPAPTLENPTNRQEPAVSLEWVGPATARLNQNTVYQIIAKNINTAPVQNVIVRYRIPVGVQITGMEPKALNEGSLLTWDLGTLMPAQEKRIDLQLMPEARAELNCQASVTFTGTSTFKVQVREPKLTIKAAAPEHVVLGDIATVSLTVSNPGDGTADRVKLKALLPEGLENARGKMFKLELGSLAPGENRTVQVVCLTKAAGMQPIDCVAFADAGLNSQDTAKVDVVLPRLDLVISGPKLRYLDRHAIFVLKVTNPGSAPAGNVSVIHQLPQGFKFFTASNGGRHDANTRTVSWFVGDLTPGESREVSVDLVAVNIGEHHSKSVATAARGLRTESETVTRVEGLSALLMELVDTEDPIEVGAETSYEIRVTNTGSKTETNLELVCTVPDKMEFRAAKCAAGCRFRVEGKEIIFEPLPKLAPRADVVYRIVVRGMAPGDMRFRARIRADGLSEPVLREESTKVYGDDGGQR